MNDMRLVDDPDIKGDALYWRGIAQQRAEWVVEWEAMFGPSSRDDDEPRLWRAESAKALLRAVGAYRPCRLEVLHAVTV